MFRISSKPFLKIAAPSFLDELEDVDWGDDDQPEESTGYVDQDNYSDYLADELDEGDSEETAIEAVPRPPTEAPPPSQQQPEENQIEYTNSIQLVNDGVANQEVISFDYTNRYGMYCGRRTVEPHYTFQAMSTGNLVLVTFDQDYNDIRAFIVGNIHPYGVRYKGFKFAPRAEIMRGP